MATTKQLATAERDALRRQLMQESANRWIEALNKAFTEGRLKPMSSPDNVAGQTRQARPSTLAIGSATPSTKTDDDAPR